MAWDPQEEMEQKREMGCAQTPRSQLSSMRQTEPEGWVWSGDYESLWNDASMLFTRGIPGVSLEAGVTRMLSWLWAMSWAYPTLHARG